MSMLRNGVSLILHASNKYCSLEACPFTAELTYNTCRLNPFVFPDSADIVSSFLSKCINSRFLDDFSRSLTQKAPAVCLMS